MKKAGQFEKVDYAIYLNGALALFVECKALGAVLQDNGGQLSRYFNSEPNVRCAVITDGVRIRVYTDLQQPNIMDPNPWLEIDLLDIKPAEVDLLRRFRKADFVPGNITELAEETVYYNTIVKMISSQLHEPSESFVRWVVGELPNSPRVTAKIVERMTPILRRAVQSAIVDHVARSFARPPEQAAPAEQVAVVEATSAAAEPKGEAKPGVVTTADELEVAKIVEGWVKELRPNGEFGFRDGKGYFTLHQNNLRKWFARFGLDKKPGWVALRHVKPEEARTLAPGLDVTEGSSFGDVRIAVPVLPELYKLRSALMAAYEREASRVGEDPADSEAR